MEVIKRREFKDRNFWIGLTDRKSEGDWRFESSGLRPLYKNWGSSEPKGGHNENCAQIWNKYLTWSDVPCDIYNTSLWSGVEYKSFHALCEFQESGEQNSPQTSIIKRKHLNLQLIGAVQTFFRNSNRGFVSDRHCHHSFNSQPHPATLDSSLHLQTSTKKRGACGRGAQERDEPSVRRLLRRH